MAVRGARASSNAFWSKNERYAAIRVRETSIRLILTTGISPDWRPL